MTLSFAVIPTHNRHEMLTSLVRSLDKTVDCVIVVDNASTPPIVANDLHQRALTDTQVLVISVPDQPPNLYRLWNLGFDAAARMAEARGESTWNVAVLNDDTELPSGWTESIGDSLRSSPAAIACGAEGPNLRAPILKTRPIRFPRMTPHAFIMKGELGLRGDEDYAWWYGDTQLDLDACTAGGVLIIPGYVALNKCANSTTVGALAEQAGRDGATFARKWAGRI